MALSRPSVKVPACPACKAKFSHNSALLQCNKCGLPDEVAMKGPQAIARWKRKPTRTTVTESGLVVRTEGEKVKRVRRPKKKPRGSVMSRHKRKINKQKRKAHRP